jgi:hypothetical protein
VTDISLDEMRVIFELRAAGGALAVREAAPDADKETLKRLIASVDAMEAAAERGDVEGLVLEDMGRDLALEELSGYPVLKRIWSVLDNQVRRFIYQARGPPCERTARDPRVAPARAAIARSLTRSRPATRIEPPRSSPTTSSCPGSKPNAASAGTGLPVRAVRRAPRSHAAVSTLPPSTKPGRGEVRSARRIVEPGEESHER